MGVIHRTVCSARLQRERLRHHLADDDVEVGEDGDREHARDGVGGNPACRSERLQPLQVLDEPRGQALLAIHAQREARDCDAQLRRRDVAVLPARVLQDHVDPLRRRSPCDALPLDRRPRRADNGELRRHEQPFQQNHGW